MKNFVFLITAICFFVFSFNTGNAQNQISIDSLKSLILKADTSKDIYAIEQIMENYIYKEESNYYLLNTMTEIRRDEIFTKEKIRTTTGEEIKKRLITFLSTGNGTNPGDSLLPVYVLSMLMTDAMFNNNFFSIDAQNIIASHPVLDYLIKSSTDKDVKQLFSDLKIALTKSATTGYEYYSTDEYKKLIESFKLSRDKIEKMKGVKK